MISIRRAKPEEADTLTQIAIAAKSHWDYPEHWKQLWIPQLNFAPAYFQEHESWAAALQGEVIAFYTLEEKNGNARLENLWVLPKHIGHGVGKELFMHSLSRAREMGYKILQLEAEPNALGFYEKMGMRRVSQRQYELDGQLRILPIMEIDL